MLRFRFDWHTSAMRIDERRRLSADEQQKGQRDPKMSNERQINRLLG